MQPYDLLIKGGNLIDPFTKTNHVQDIAIKDGKIAHIDNEIDTNSSQQIIDARGLIVTAGLIDLHTHCYYGAGYWSIKPDHIMKKTGVTTWVDAGSSGAYNFTGFYDNFISNALVKTRIFAFLNISAIGLVARTHELKELENLDTDIAIKMGQMYSNVIKGIKVRMDAETSVGTGLEGIKRARFVADVLNVPIMVHIGKAPPSLIEISNFMKKGDILTHCCTPHSNRLIDSDGKLLPCVLEMKSKGVIFDTGCGSGSFSFDIAERMISQGLFPSTISSDIHQMSFRGPTKNLPLTLSKFLSLGLDLMDVIAKATIEPAKILNELDLGRIFVGGVADIATWFIDETPLKISDSLNNERTTTKHLVNVHTIKSGELMIGENETDEKIFPWIEKDLAKVVGIAPITR